MSNNFSRRRLMQTASLAPFAPLRLVSARFLMAAGARPRHAEDLPGSAAECR